MYAAGSDLLGLDPADCLFIDDDPQLLLSAITESRSPATNDRTPRSP
jgi:hypothetical protein